MFTDKTTQSVADAVKKIMEADAQKKVEEALIGAQKNIDKNHNNKIDAQDFKILKGQKTVKEDNKDTPPFDGPYKSSFKKPNNPNRTGMDAARSLAQRAMDKVAKKEPRKGVAEGSLEEVSLDLAKRARDKAEHIVDMDHDDMRDRPYGYTEKQRIKFQRYVDKKHTPVKAVKEESEQIEEVKLADLTPRKIEGKSYGKSYVDPEGSEDADDKPSKKKVSKGTYASRATRGFETPAAKAKKDAKIAMRRESFTELLNSYQENGIKGLFEKLEYVEEDYELDEANTESKKEFVARQARLAAAGAETAKDPERLKRMMKIPGYAAAMGLAKKTTKEEVEQIEERTLTDDETDKKEHIVKSMKKGLAGFKDRYGKDAKSVMYATATKQAKKD